MVSRALASGPRTLRDALLDARAGDVITFDLAVFQPDAPTAITVEGELPHFTQGNLTIDGSDADVILDGGQLPAGSFRVDGRGDACFVDGALARFDFAPPRL